MTELLGKSVGEWSANEYANFGMPIGIPQGTIGRDRLQRALEEGRRAQIALGLRNEAIARAENQAGQQINRDSSTGDVTVNRSGIDLGGSANTGMSDAVDLPQRIRQNPKRLPKRIQKKSVVLDASSDTLPMDEVPMSEKKGMNKTLMYVVGSLVLVIGGYLVFKKK
jgi:hypothetical protein